MASRTNTLQTTVFKRQPPEAVTYDVSEPNLVLITVPPGSTWSTGLHWHETHDEYFEVVQGRILLTIRGDTRVVKAGSGILEISKYTNHEWRRDPTDTSQTDVIVKERTAPADGEKEAFFRSLNSYLLEPSPAKLHGQIMWPFSTLEGMIEGWTVMIQLYMIFLRFDNYPVLLGRSTGFFSRAVTYLALWVASLVGHSLGLSSEYPEYVGRRD